MGTFGKIRHSLQLNSKEELLECQRLLVKILDNILKSPENEKVRILKKSNPTISKKIVALNGGAECLKLLGFTETDTLFALPQNFDVNVLKQRRQELEALFLNGTSMIHSTAGPSNINTSLPRETTTQIRQITLPPLNHMYTNPFLKTVETHFNNVLIYENKVLQKRALAHIPLLKLEENAQKSLRSVQEKIKKGELPDQELSVQEFLILELLDWFKNDFFTWVDSPPCEKCEGKSEMSHMSTDPNLLQYTNRVEMHKCLICSHLTPFPRYNDPNILLETRRGRCGEWANTFTLLCRSMEWDARFVVDEGDHVWTEVYSFAQKRWLHCDPCENVCDTPLMYETGWGKKISYVIAYAHDDIQDVSWRYSTNHKEVLKRRKMLPEAQFLNVILELRKKRQESLSKSRKEYLVKRNLAELIELMIAKKPSEKDQHGRTSGSKSWRLARGEADQENVNTSFTWKITNSEISDNSYSIKYSCSLDEYQTSSANKLKKWFSGVFHQQNIFRKEEKDWKNVYLARKEGTSHGSITWKFEFQSKIIDAIEVKLDCATFESGKIVAKLCNTETCVLLPNSKLIFKTKDLAGSSSVELNVKMSEGKGDVAWQHAQLFRQKSDSIDEYPFEIKFIFK